MMRALWLGLLLVAPGVAWGEGESARFVRKCPILVQPKARSKRICVKPAGTPLQEVQPRKDGFARVDTGDCVGYAPLQCVMLTGSRRPASEAPTGRRVSAGVALHVDGLAGAPTGGQGTAGLGFGLGFPIVLPLSRSFRLVAKPSYQVLSLSRAFDFSGVVLEPSETRFFQRIPCLGASLLGGLRMFGSASNDWWFDLGGEFLLPLSGRQSDSSGDSIGFSPPGKFLFLVGGISTRFPLSRTLLAGGFLHGYYSLGGSTLIGARVGAQVYFRL